MPEKAPNYTRKSRYLTFLSRKILKPWRKSRTYIYYRDLYNKLKYGLAAPRYAERIWVDPKQCTRYLPHDLTKQYFGKSKRKASGKVIDFQWPLEQAKPIFSLPKVKFCIEHWAQNMPWEDTGLYDFMEKHIREHGSMDGCYNLEDIKKRYEYLDQVFEQVKAEGRFRTREEIKPGSYLEQDGVIIHIGPGGEPFFSRGGNHRFAMAWVLNLIFPAQIGCVHISAIPYLKSFRKKFNRMLE